MQQGLASRQYNLLAPVSCPVTASFNSSAWQPRCDVAAEAWTVMMLIRLTACSERACQQFCCSLDQCGTCACARCSPIEAFGFLDHVLLLSSVASTYQGTEQVDILELVHKVIHSESHRLVNHASHSELVITPF